MAASTDSHDAPVGSPAASRWPVVAAAFLGIQGFNTIFYAPLIPAPISDAGITVPLLGHLPFVWIIAGGAALAAAVGVLRRRTWGRILGIGSEILTIAGVLMTAPSLLLAAPTLAIANVVIFALWRRWPVATRPDAAPVQPGAGRGPTQP